MSYWEPDDPPELPDGWIDEDTVEQLKSMMRFVEFHEDFPRPGNRHDAALVMLDHILNPPNANQPDDPIVMWAKVLMKDHL